MNEIAANIIANLISALIVAFLGWILLLLLWLPAYRKRRRLFQFFGIPKAKPRLIVYFSTVFVVPGGSTDFHGMGRSFQGPAIPQYELLAIRPIEALFEDPLLEGLPHSVREWLSIRVHWTFGQVTPYFVASPQETSQVEQGSIITVGSQYYNSAGELYTETCKPQLKMVETEQDMVIRIVSGPRMDEAFRPREGHVDDLAIVEKVYDEKTQSTIIFAAGIRAGGTIGAIQFIANRWTELYDDLGTQPFAICLRFQDIDKDPSAFSKPIEMARL